ncbi:MAG: hypothetical protein COA49_09565 [Bacteroidetes bacterium]|nr:MAG: hypothetical protein COA49_09565 [Bacteroidota bacterium]
MAQYYKFISVLSLTLLTVSSSNFAQTAEPIDSYTSDEISYLASIFQIPSIVYSAEYDVDAYRVIYEMPYLDSVITVSGALFIPQGIDSLCSLPVMTYMHGTIFERTNAPSFLPIEGRLGFLMSSPGFIVLMPDYVGLGTSDLMHPYVQAKSEADAGIYLLQAAETLGAELGYSFNGEFFSSGYSQGGHASMAFSRELEANWADTYPLTASAPLSGPYDISGTQFIQTFENPSYSNPAYLAYNIIGWNSYYGNIYENLNEIFQEPYATELPGMFNGETSGLEINNYLPYLLGDLLQPGLVDAIIADPNHPFNLAAIDNDVYQWIPQSPMKIYYCTEDEQVFYDNAIIAEAWMTENGATNVTTSNGGPFNHSDCAGPAIIGGMLWMQGYHVECIPESVGEIDEMVWSINPNPAVNGISTLKGLPINTSWDLRDISGRLISRGTGTKIDFTGLPEGVYFVQTNGWGTKKVLFNFQ